MVYYHQVTKYGKEREIVIFRICPVCGCTLDPEERCDCLETGKEAAPAATGTTSAKWTCSKSTSRVAVSQGCKGGSEC